jgi:multimeric flavodoxin WrbA
MKVVAINGSPHEDKGNTALILGPFVEGMKAAGAQVRVFLTKGHAGPARARHERSGRRTGRGPAAYRNRIDCAGNVERRQQALAAA